MNSTISDKLKKVEKLAKNSRLGRFFHHPAKYLFAFLFRKILYPFRKKELILTANLFFDKPIKIALPASTDIYLTGGKSHDSEIRLAKFLINNLYSSDHFLDIGAHYGYFSMLAAEMIGNSGKIIAFEPTERSFQLLEENIDRLPFATALQQAVSNEKGMLTFYEFPNLYSEYNSTDITQFEKEAWFLNAKPKRVEVPTVTIDEITSENSFRPKIIKIDVEGAEYQVIRGGLSFLEAQQPILIMEYLSAERHNESHRKAAELLKSLHYNSFVIKSDGSLESIENIDLYLNENKLESDNIVFK